MALFLFLLFVSGPVRSVCFFLRLFRGLLLWGIQFLFFLLLLISHREQLLLVQGHQMRDLPPKTSDSEKIGQTGGYPRLTSLSIKTPSQRRAEAPG